MSHINLPQGEPGIRSLVLYRPETGKHLYALVQILLRGESPLSEADRELIAAYVSHLNGCRFCTESHAAAARCLYKSDVHLVDEVLQNMQRSTINDKLKALLRIAAKVQVSGKEVTTEDVDAARAAGATDRELHDTVLIAATFCLFNRYVDGLATLTPTEADAYNVMGKKMAAQGYVFSANQT